MKIICIGRNYHDHIKELANELPSKPLVFMKPATALLVNGKDFYYPEFTQDIHYEIEIVLKICKNGRHVQPEFANSYFEEVSVGIDFTARDIQQACKAKGHPWEIAKSFDHSAVIGTFVRKEDVASNGSIDFSLSQNGEVKQKGNTADMIFDFQAIICYVSKYFKLQVGDYIFTGTPAGVGPITIGDHLQGYIGSESLLNCHIK